MTDAIAEAIHGAVQQVEQFELAAGDLWYQAERMKLASKAILAEFDAIADGLKEAMRA